MFTGKEPGFSSRRRDGRISACDGELSRVETTSAPLRRRRTLIGATRCSRGARRETRRGSPYEPGTKRRNCAALRVSTCWTPSAAATYEPVRKPAGSAGGAATVPTGDQTLPSVETPTICPAGAPTYAMSTGQGSVVAGERPNCNALPVTDSETVVAIGIAPGCHVTVAV